MAIKTRKLTQWLVYELVEVRIYAADANGNKRTDYIPVAIFDDKDKLNAYLQLFSASDEHSVREEWVSIEPVESNFSLPFNPAPVRVVNEEEK